MTCAPGKHPHPIAACLRPWRFALCLLAGVAGAAGSDAAPGDDVAAWEKIRIRRERPLLIETALVKEGAAAAAIVPGAGEPWAGAARTLRSAIETKTGVTLPIVSPGDISDADWSARNLILIGNLQVNPVYARLYHNLFVCADAAYTGAGGFELRTVHDPWGNGHNAVALGAQAPAGLQRGLARLLALADGRARPGDLTLGRLLEVKFDAAGRRAPVDARLSAKDVAARKESLANVYANPGTERSAAHDTVEFAMRHHRTGDPGWLDLYRDGMRRQMEHYAGNEYIREGGPRRYDREFRDSWAYGMVIAWDLMEEAPGWHDAERLALVNHVLRLVWECNLYQGWDRPETVERWRRFESITHNHHTWPGLANLFGGWYFSRHYNLPAARDWLEIALGMFRSCSRSAKPWEDSAGYQWIPQRHILTYAFATGDRTLIEQGHAAHTGELSLMAIDSLGHQPGWGDHGGFTTASRLPELYSALEHATGDGRYRWAIERLGLDARGEMQEPYWSAVAPCRPDNLTGIAVSRLPRMFFDLLGRTSNKSIFQAPNVPFERSFDKLTLRDGWDERDDYLMLDGTAAGSHGHLDGNAIVAFTAAGAHWLVDGEYIRRFPKVHCAVTVLRDGVGAIMPACAQLEHAAGFDGGALARTTMPHYNGVTWTRNVVWVAKRHVAVIDEINAERDGDYSLRCCWRVAGTPALEGDTLRVRQGAKGFTLRNLGGQRQELMPVRTVAGLPIHHLYQRASARLRRGETIRFLNVFAAREQGAPELDAIRLGEARGAVTSGDARELFGAGGLEGALATDAALYRIAGTSAWLAGATRFAVRGVEYLDADTPVAARIAPAGVALAAPARAPRPGMHAVPVPGAPQPPARPLALSSLIEEMHAAAQPEGPAPLAAPSPRPPRPLRTLWRFAGFSAPARPVPVARVRSDTVPRAPYAPLERLIDGAWNGSITSCMFAAGRTVCLTLDLGARTRVRGVRVRSWEMRPHWKLRRVRLGLSDDGFRRDARAAGDLFEVGTRTSGSNVSTIRASGALDEDACQVRVTCEPATAESVVYLAEIEVLGEQRGETAALVALASCDLDRDGREDALVGTANGEIVALNADGRRLWSAAVNGAVTALAGGASIVLYGTDQSTLGALGAGGEHVAEVKPPPYRGIRSTVRNVTPADLDGDGRREIVVGCDSWQYMAYRLDPDTVRGASSRFELVWKSVFYAHGATVAHVADLDGDRHPEIVAGNAYYRVQILDRRGRVIASGPTLGPEQSAAGSVALPGSNRRAAILGADDGTLLACDARGTELWRADVGDRVTSLLCAAPDGGPAVVAASESGFLWAFDTTGRMLWKRDLGEPVRRLARDGDAMLAAASGAGIVRLSREGDIEAVARTPAPVTDLIACDGRIVALSADGTALGIAAR